MKMLRIPEYLKLPQGAVVEEDRFR